jgi:hypothetical protein
VVLVLNVRSLITVYSANVKVDLTVIHCLDVQLQYNVVTPIVRAMNLACFVQQNVVLTRTACADKNARRENAVKNATLEHVHPDNFVKTTLAWLDAVPIPTVQMIEHASTNNVWIHVSVEKHVELALNVQCPIIVLFVYVQTDFKGSQPTNVCAMNVKPMMTVNTTKNVWKALVVIHAQRPEVVASMLNVEL